VILLKNLRIYRKGREESAKAAKVFCGCSFIHVVDVVKIRDPKRPRERESPRAGRMVSIPKCQPNGCDQTRDNNLARPGGLPAYGGASAKIPRLFSGDGVFPAFLNSAGRFNQNIKKNLHGEDEQNPHGHQKKALPEFVPRGNGF
jgi:hypothetical protein